MNIELPLYRQEKRNTCALACLRMVLTACGKPIAESALEAQSHMEPEGTDIGELERLARQFGLVANIEEATIPQLRQLLAEGKLVMAYIDRAVFNLSPARRAHHSLRSAKIHVVVPTRISETSVTYHDPLPPRIARRSIHLFRTAFEHLGSRCVVCSKKLTQG